MGVVMAGSAVTAGNVDMVECCRFPVGSLVAVFARIVCREVSLRFAGSRRAIMAGGAIRAEIGVIWTAASGPPGDGRVAVFAIYGGLDMSGWLTNGRCIGGRAVMAGCACSRYYSVIKLHIRPGNGRVAGNAIGAGIDGHVAGSHSSCLTIVMAGGAAGVSCDLGMVKGDCRPVRGDVAIFAGI